LFSMSGLANVFHQKSLVFVTNAVCHATVTPTVAMKVVTYCLFNAINVLRNSPDAVLKNAVK